MDTLLLNSDGTPLAMLPPSIIDWRLAIKLVYLDKVTIVREYADRTIRSQHLEIYVPSVVMTKKYVRPQHKVKFNRKMVYLRDNYTCQYCGEQFTAKDLTLDHVNPKSKGGDASWTNLVTCCGTCNWLKGAKAIEPIKKPHEPTYWQMVRSSKRSTSQIHLRDPAWAEYLGIDPVNVQLMATG